MLSDSPSDIPILLDNEIIWKYFQAVKVHTIFRNGFARAIDRAGLPACTFANWRRPHRNIDNATGYGILLE